MTPPRVFRYEDQTEKPWAADCCGVGRDFDTEQEAYLWVVDRLWHKLNDAPCDFDRGPTGWRDAMRGDFERLRLIWVDAEQKPVLPTEQHPLSYDQARDVAMLHYRAGYENAMRITYRLLTAFLRLSVDSRPTLRGPSWIGAVIHAWVIQEMHTLENEQVAAYNSLKRAEMECAWERPQS